MYFAGRGAAPTRVPPANNLQVMCIACANCGVSALGPVTFDGGLDRKPRCALGAQMTIPGAWNHSIVKIDSVMVLSISEVPKEASVLLFQLPNRLGWCVLSVGIRESPSLCV
uniref:CENP-V/GFA domain-containing protein n=1 Tax=Mesocestoides corti TaxID=53468 RepID=A0A5K3EL81_MESCO